jgi:hypothetical protein
MWDVLASSAPMGFHGTTKLPGCKLGRIETISLRWRVPECCLRKDQTMVNAISQQLQSPSVVTCDVNLSKMATKLARKFWGRSILQRSSCHAASRYSVDRSTGDIAHSELVWLNAYFRFNRASSALWWILDTIYVHFDLFVSGVDTKTTFFNLSYGSAFALPVVPFFDHRWHASIGHALIREKIEGDVFCVVTNGHHTWAIN